MKKILILGAGVYQVPLIKTAKRLGIQSVVCSIPGNYPGFGLADKMYYENTTDHEKILEIAREEKVDVPEQLRQIHPGYRADDIWESVLLPAAPPRTPVPYLSCPRC